MDPTNARDRVLFSWIDQPRSANVTRDAEAAKASPNGQAPG